MYKMCNGKCSAVAGTKKKSRRRSSRVSGIKMQSPKALLNLPTLGAAGATAIGVGKMVEKATGDELAIFRSKQGAQILAAAGAAGAFLTPGGGMLAKIARGAALGMAAHGLKVILTDEDWAGNAVTADKMDAVKGVTWWPGYDHEAGTGVGRTTRRP